MHKMIFKEIKRQRNLLVAWVDCRNHRLCKANGIIRNIEDQQIHPKFDRSNEGKEGWNFEDEIFVETKKVILQGDALSPPTVYHISGRSHNHPEKSNTWE